MTYPTYAEINLKRLENNYRIIKQKSCDLPVMAVVKADAYGHGAIECANVLYLNGVRFFAVANLAEAIEIRSAFQDVNILILGFTPTENADMLSEKRITQTVFSLDYAEKLSRSASKPIDVHLKVDTGMNRLGFKPNESDMQKASQAMSLPKLHYSGIFTHFACADSKDKTFTNNQYLSFVSAVDYLEKKNGKFKIRHACNSAGILEHPDKYLDMVRAGIILYGLRPSDEVYDVNVKPVMKFCSTVAATRMIKTGETVGYGASFTALHDMRIATIAAGYADGYQRRYGQNGNVTIRGKQVSVIGRVCMDQFMVDVTPFNDIDCGDTVELFGDIISADELAGRVGTIGYEVVCGVGKRVKRIYL